MLVSGRVGHAPSKRARSDDEQDHVVSRVKAKAVTNSDFIVRQIARKADTFQAAAKFFMMLRRTVGQPNATGRIFTEEDIGGAWRRCRMLYSEDAASSTESSDTSSSSSDSAEDGASISEASSDSDSSSASSSLHAPHGSADHAAWQRRRQARAQKRKEREETLERMFFEAEEDLSGEEEVDEEPEADSGTETPTQDTSMSETEYTVEDDSYPATAWVKMQPHLLPGHDGFNRRCTAVMQQAGIGTAPIAAQTSMTATASSSLATPCPPLQPHQEAVGFLLHPRSPVTRLLVDHPTGSGKTREMIRVLSNFFNDPRPKVPIFPKEPVCRNFYVELLRWPSRYRDYFCCMRPMEAATACGSSNWRKLRECMWNLSKFSEDELRRLCYTLREVLEMKNMFFRGKMRPGLRHAFRRRHPNEMMPAGPMRALSYTSAGGNYTNLREGLDIPISAMMKIGYHPGSGNVYTSKVVVMDEAHNLVRTQTQYGVQLQRLRDLLVRGKDLVLAGFTGTPILNTPDEGRQLLDIIKGRDAPRGDEGFISSFPMRPRQLFALSLPRGVPDAVLTRPLQKKLVVRVKLRGEALRVYDRKKCAGLTGRRLAAFCNVSSFFGSFHDGKSGTKERIMGSPGECCPKLLAIARDVAVSREKSLVMVSKQSGYAVMLEIMRQVAMNSNPPFQVATIDELAQFNHVSNLRGEVFRVIIADSNQCSEGVSFFAVRRTFLADVPVSPSQFIQQCGRSIRMYGHRGLPAEEQTVTNRLYVAELPRWMRSPLACFAFRAQRHVKGEDLEVRARKLLARLQRLGIRTLTELKQRIDAHGQTKQRTLNPMFSSVEEQKGPLATKDVMLFLELTGLWNTAPPAPRVVQAGQTRASSIDMQRRLKAAKLAAAGSSRFAELKKRLGSGLASGLKPPATPQGRSSQTSDKALPGKITENQGGAKSALSIAALTEISNAVFTVRAVCDQIDRGMAKPLWQNALSEGLRVARASEHISSLLQLSATHAFDTEKAHPSEWTALEVKMLFNRLTRAEKVEVLNTAFSRMSDLCSEIEEFQKTEDQKLVMDVCTEKEAWRCKLQECVTEFLRWEPVTGALKRAAPSVYEAWKTDGLPDLTVDQAKALRDELRRHKERSEKITSGCSGLVRTLKELYLAASLEDAAKSLACETADQEALQHLAVRSQEFADALAVLRSQAIDFELFKHLSEEQDGESASDRPSSGVSEASDGGTAFDVADGPGAGAGESESQPVRLPQGWKLQWVKGKTSRSKPQYRFVDPQQRKYTSVWEVRLAITGGAQAVEAARRARQAPGTAKAARLPRTSRVKRPRSRW